MMSFGCLKGASSDVRDNADTTYINMNTQDKG